MPALRDTKAIRWCLPGGPAAYSSRTSNAISSVRGNSGAIGIHHVIGSVYRKLKMPCWSSNGTLLLPSW